MKKNLTNNSSQFFYKPLFSHNDSRKDTAIPIG